jgi:hypothetical protein
MKALFFLISNANNQLLDQEKKVKSVFFFTMPPKKRNFKIYYFLHFKSKRGKIKTRKKQEMNYVFDQTQKGRS